MQQGRQQELKDSQGYHESMENLIQFSSILVAKGCQKSHASAIYKQLNKRFGQRQGQIAKHSPGEFESYQKDMPYINGQNNYGALSHLKHGDKHNSKCKILIGQRYKLEKQHSI